MPAADPAEIVRHLSAVDRRLAKLIQRAGPFTLRPQRGPLFQGLSRSIVFQQLSTKAATTIYGRLQAQLPAQVANQPRALLNLSDEQFRTAGVSRPKMAALRDLAQRTEAGQVPERRQAARWADEAIIEQLVQIRGVGRWTAQMILIFWLGRPDVLPVLDLGVRRGFALTYGKPELPQPDDLERLGRKWRPYRSAAAWYLWRACDLAAKNDAQDGWS